MQASTCRLCLCILSPVKWECMLTKSSAAAFTEQTFRTDHLINKHTEGQLALVVALAEVTAKHSTEPLWMLLEPS